MGVVYRDRWKISCFLIFGMILVGGCAAAQSGPHTSDKISDLQNLDQFRMLFNEEKGTPRLILLVSPT